VVKFGRFFKIPEHPTDVQLLWERAQPLKAGCLPAWLTWEDASGYRHLDTASRAGLSTTEQSLYLAELEQCRRAGLILDPDAYDASTHHLFIAAPRREAIWSIGIYRGQRPFDLTPATASPVLTRAHVTDVPATFVADPFLFFMGSLWYVFFEVMNWRNWKGEIGYATSPDGVKWTYGSIALAEPFHLSYPYVFTWEGKIYMVPESYEAGSVRLYEAVDFPTRWRCTATLLRGPYFADTSLFRHDGRWWLYTDASRDLKNDTLRLFWADQLHGPWNEHPRSPILQDDPKHSRPAGRVIKINDKLVRFAQSCVPNYGTDVRVFEIDHLTLDSYQEREVLGNPLLEPSGKGWNSCGMHHIDLHCLEDGSWLAAVDGWCWG
jgi:hypothetical protein